MDATKRFTLRLDGKLFEKIKTLSKQNKRATGKQIEFILEQYIEKLQTT